MEKNKSAGTLGVSGCETSQRRILHYLNAGRVHPAIVLAGPEKITKFEIAKAMAKYLLCQKKTGPLFCGECSACRRVEKEIHPDVLIFKDDGEEALKIETVREICHQMQISPMEAPAKICIIDECHRMNTASANAFLKTLEEPGQERYFWLLTTQPGALLPTILSRCLTFTFKPEAEAPELSPTDQEEFKKLFEDFSRTKNIQSVVSALEEKPRVLGFLRYLQRELRSTVLSPNTGLPVPAAFRKLSSNDCVSKFEATVELEGRLRSNANYGLMLESLLRRYFLPQ